MIRSKTFTVSITGDDTPEFNETFTVALSTATSGATISATKGKAQGSITNDDGTGLRILPASLAEGATGATNNNMVFTVEAVPPSSTPITFDWTTGDDTGANLATADTDYSMTSNTGETIAADARSVTISVPITGDNIAEADETFVVTISNPSSGVELLNTSAIGTIQNDDGSVLMIIFRITK